MCAQSFLESGRPVMEEMYKSCLVPILALLYYIFLLCKGCTHTVRMSLFVCCILK